MTEIDVTLTDYVLFALCLFFSRVISRQPSNQLEMKKIWTWFFISIAVGSLTGGTVHGFFSDPSTLGYKILWTTMLLSIGLTASMGWILAGMMTSGGRLCKGWVYFAAATFVFYAAIVLFYSQRFITVIVNYLPAMVALMVAGLINYFKSRSTFNLWTVFGILTSFVAAYIQQVHIAIHPEYFNHNSTFHLVQAGGLWMLYRGAYAILSTKPLR